MLLPQYLIRQKKLQQALIDYPIYDPPHKVEERTLSPEKAKENFDYFLRTRHERAQYFLSWLQTEFDVRATLEDEGVGQILEWATKYVAVLMPPLDREAGSVYLEYSQPWTGAYAGANALFDLSTTLGEAIIRRRPSLEWKMEWSLSDFQNYKTGTSRDTQLMLLSIERDERRMRRDRGSGHGRPVLASATNPLDFEPVFAATFTYYLLMTMSVGLAYAWRNFKRPKGLRSKHPGHLRSFFERATRQQSSH